MVFASIGCGWLTTAPAFATPIQDDAPGRAPLSRTLQDSWRWVRYSTLDGLPSNRIIEVSTTSDRVWALTDRGPAVFDGWRWTPIPLPLDGVGETAGSSEPLSVPGDDTIGIWTDAGTFVGGVDGFLRTPGRVKGPLRYPLRAGSRFVRGGWMRSSLGSRWDVGSGHIYRIDAKDASKTRVPFAEDLLVGPRLIVEGPDRATVIGIGHPASVRGLWELSAEGELTQVESSRGHFPDEGDVATDGRALVSSNSAIHIRESGEWQTFTKLPRALTDPTDVRFDSEGDLWVSTVDGLYLHRGSSRRWKVWDRPQINSTSYTNDICIARDGRIWIATSSGIELRSKDGVRLPLPSELLTVPSATTLAEDRDGRIWIGSGGDYPGVFCMAGEGCERVTKGADGRELGYVHRIRASSDGRLWFMGLGNQSPDMSDSGSLPFVLGSDLRVFEPAFELGLSRYYDFAEGLDGSYWFATVDGLLRYRDERWRRWNKSSGLAANRVYCLAIDPSDGRPWFAVDTFGLATIENEEVVDHTDLSYELGLGPKVTSLRFAFGRMWATTETGLGCIANDRVTLFGPSSGFDNARAWPIAVLGNSLLVGSLGATYVLDTSEIRADRLDVQVSRGNKEGDTTRVSWRVLSERGDLPQEMIATRSSIDGGETWTAWSQDRTVSIGASETPVDGEDFVVQAAGPMDSEPTGVAKLRWVGDRPLIADPYFVIPIALLLAGGLFLGVRMLHARRGMRRSESSFRAAMEQASDAIFLLDPDGRVLESNPRLGELLGRSSDSLIGEVADDLLVGQEEDVRSLSLNLDGGGTPLRTRAFKHSVEGSPIPVELGVRKLDDGRYFVVARDLRERHARESARLDLERRLADGQREESLAVLAGGVAHDFNNLLTAVMGNAEQALSGVERQSPVWLLLRSVISGAKRAAELTQQLLAYSGRGAVVRERVDVNELLIELSSLLRASVPKGITLKVETDPAVGHVEADGGRIQQVMVNLIVNASEAIGDERGVVMIETHPVNEDDVGMKVAFGNVAPPVAERWIRIRIRDTGPGIPASDRGRIFEPFFTTKFDGRGLGLSAVRGIIQSHSGAIHVSCPQQGGTLFEIFLPATSEVSPVAPKRRVFQGVGIALVIDDEQAVRDVAQMALERIGYRTLAASGGSDGERLYADQMDEIQVVLVDLTMPDKSGLDVLSEIRRHSVDIPVVLMSGYPASDAADRIAADPHLEFLQKPFSIADLGATLRVVCPERDWASEDGGIG